MELKIVGDQQNKTFGRRDISFSILGEGPTPSKEAIKTELCKKLNLNPDSTAIVAVKQVFGARAASGTAHSYESPEAMKHYEQKYLFERADRKNKKGGEAKPEEKPKEEKKEGAEAAAPA